MRSRLSALTELDTRDTTVLKALAILAIVLHNFFHFVSPARENEFDFHPGGLQVFVGQAMHAALAIQAFFSFFGHFGVQVFIFLSAFGLAKSHWDDPSSWWRFMLGRVKKLYPNIMLIVLPWVLGMALFLGPHRLLHEIAPGIVAMLLGFSTLVGFGLPPVGPWWFIPFILQFYAMWLLLRRISVRFGWKGLLALSVVCVVLILTINPLLERRSVNLLMTPIGHMPELCFGILAARYRFGITATLAAAGSGMLVVGSIYPSLFPLTFCGALLTALWIYVRLRGGLRESRLLVRIGECSMLIFLLNGIVRNELVGYASTPPRQLGFGLVSAALSVMIADLILRLLDPKRSGTELLAPSEVTA